MDRRMRISTDLVEYSLKPKYLLWEQPKSIFHIREEFQEDSPFYHSLMRPPFPRPAIWVSAGQVSKLSRCPTQECQVRLLSSKCSPIIQGIASPHREKRGSPLFLSTTLLPKFTSFLFPVFHLNAARPRPREKWIKEPVHSSPQSWRQMAS